VRFTLAENHNVPEEILQILAQDENCYVCSRATRTLQRLSPPAPAVMKFRKQETEALPMRKRATK
jgi:vesicle coat complex subunit